MPEEEITAKASANEKMLRLREQVATQALEDAEQAEAEQAEAEQAAAAFAQEQSELVAEPDGTDEQEEE